MLVLWLVSLGNLVDQQWPTARSSVMAAKVDLRNLEIHQVS